MGTLSFLVLIFMKMKRLYLLSIPMLFLFTSCANRLDENNDGKTVIYAEMESDEIIQTKSCIDPSTYSDNKTGILWTSDDKLGVFGDGSSVNVPFTNSLSSPAGNAAFTGTLAAGENPHYAYFPYTVDNDCRAISSLSGSVSSTQTWDSKAEKLNDDWKYGMLRTSVSGGHYFTMKHLFSLAKLDINASGTPIEGESLESITIKVEASGSSVIRRINGSFTFSAVDGSYTMNGDAVDGSSNVTEMVWSSKPVLSSGASHTGYLSIVPDVKAGDKITLTVTTDKHIAEFCVPCLLDFAADYIYTMPMKLSDLATKMNDAYGTVPTYSEIGATDPEPNVTTGTFTACAFNVDGLPQKISGITINGDGPGSSGTTTMAGIANYLGWDLIAASEDFEYDSELVAGLSNYSHGTWRGSVSYKQLTSKADTDGLNFFWRTSTTSATGETYVPYNDAEGGLTSGANTCIKKGFRHYEVTVDATNNVVIDVYITHMNTYSGSGNTESNAYVKAVLSQLRQLRDYVLEKAKANQRPAIIMGDTNMRYTRHDIKSNFLDVVAAYDNNAGYTVSDPWVEFHRNGVYPQWNSLSLMTRFAFAGDKTNDIVCADNQCGEVVDKIWYINVPGAEVQLEATAHENDVENFRKSTSNVSYSGVMVEDANGSNTSGNTKYNSNQTVSYTKDIGYSDHFPVVTTFKWTKTVANK